MGIKNYLSKRKNTFINNYRKNREREAVITKSAQEATFHARKEVRTRQAVDQEYKKHGYHRDQQGNLKRNKPTNRRTIQRTATNFTNAGNNMFTLPTTQQNRDTTPKRRKHSQTRKRKTTRQNNPWSIF